MILLSMNQNTQNILNNIWWLPFLRLHQFMVLCYRYTYTLLFYFLPNKITVLIASFFKPISVINWPVATYKFLFLMCGFFHALPLICVCTWETIKVVLTQTIIVTRLVAQAFVAPKCILCHKEGTQKSKHVYKCCK